VINLDTNQLQHWIGALFWPFVRIGACLMIAPVFGASYVPKRLRVVLAGAITLAVAPLLPAVPDVALLSFDGVLITVQQLIIGAALSFALQLVFDALTLGGQLLANGMGLGFAFNLDPLRGVSTPALGQLYVVLGTLVFLALNGHLALINTLVDSFRGLPVGTSGFDAARARAGGLGRHTFPRRPARGLARHDRLAGHQSGLWRDESRRARAQPVRGRPAGHAGIRTGHRHLWHADDGRRVHFAACRRL